ncbi:hypothetical protein ANOM_004589 [Aspergillus nomiae NRRL 13137]|uniref:Uncharacterized protein n=1 Tax=Aspergillus nomiae NRRL (strain ATCC 15546 / NRRL 13137 / CBS 260.88 / M93) TaxID=1509407 RepID=A0A0L1J8V1_ASPN3|nr:uncharacterized protein ANOM_004589 [Aspergillus nomiae NRRL 13137]KNG88236.1 hypothetical protein ANOM_004589 [Aspergillus nomiae NRRL 13137]
MRQWKNLIGMPHKHRAPGWRPATLRGIYLGSLAALMLTMLITIGGIYLGSAARGGLAIFSSTEDIATAQQVAYTFVPMVMGVIIGAMWSFTEYDALRLEPYFLLSNPKGASADVLLLNYVFGHFTTTPFKAARNRHWVALCVSILSIALQLILPAVLGNLVSAEVVSMQLPQTLKTWPMLINLDTHIYWTFHNAVNQSLTIDNVHSASDVIGSRRYAMPPVQTYWNSGSEDDMWRLNQSVYWADVSCAYIDGDGLLAGLSRLERDQEALPLSEVFLLDQGSTRLADVAGALDTCTARSDQDEMDTPQVQYWKLLQWNENPKICGQFDLVGVAVHANQVVLNAQHGSNKSSDGFSPFGCSVNYMMAEAEITLYANGSVALVDVQSDTTTDLSETSFDTAMFSSSLLRMAVASNTVDDQYGMLSQGDIWSEVDAAISQSFVPLMSRTFDLRQTVHVEGIRIVQRVALLVQQSSVRISAMILTFGVVLVASLLYLYPRRPNFLSDNPASIASMCCIATDVIDAPSLEMLSQMELEVLTTRQLRSFLSRGRCSWRETSQGQRLVISFPDDSTHRSQQKSRRRADPPPPFLMIPIFILEISAFLAALGGMLVIMSKSWQYGYFPPLTDIKVDDLRIIWMLLPPASAALIRGLYISVYQNFTILEPWFILQKGNATARSSFLLDYGSQSPFAVALKCFNRRYLLLGLVSLTCILNTILTILASALFSLEYSPMATDNIIESEYDHRSYTTGNHTWILAEADLFQSSIYTGIPILPWTTTSHSLLPVQSNMTEDQWATSPLVGIGANLTCQLLSAAHGHSQDILSGPTYWQYSPSGHPNTTCRVRAQESALGGSKAPVSVDFIAPTESDQRHPLCRRPGILVVAQLNEAGLDQVPTGNIATLYCESSATIQTFLATFDLRGYVETYDAMNGTDITEGPVLANITASLANYNRAFANPLESNITQYPPKSRHKILQNWFGLLAAHVYKQQNTNDLTTIDIDLLIEAATLVYQTVFAADVTLHRDFHFNRLSKPVRIPDATIYDTFMSFIPVRPAFIVVFLIIGFDTFVLMYVFITRKRRFDFPRSPRSIGSMIPWIAKSKMLDDFRDTSSWSASERAAHLMKLDKRYALIRTGMENGKGTYALDEEPSVTGESAVHDMPPKEPVVQNMPVHSDS